MARRTRTRRANAEITEVAFLPELLANLRELAQHEVHIGMEGDAELAMIAGVHEYGSRKMDIPARSFIGSGKKKAAPQIGKVVRAGLTDVAHGRRSVTSFLNDVGETGKIRVIKNFDRIRTPSLSPIYARRKSGRKILVQEQNLRDSIKYVIVQK
ncbi:hypothetical protein [Paenibacillus alvei]|uniref:hypothetical protein n=1 Tax=Paenibacillus alvei TaxID=44250 RepID=UPI0022807DF8|nr:hypothetical protein [Paenibacillus alvei]MCY7484429.1 hypothetical protein [Paenibacillus alvei]